MQVPGCGTRAKCLHKVPWPLGVGGRLCMEGLNLYFTGLKGKAIVFSRANLEGRSTAELRTITPSPQKRAFEEDCVTLQTML